MFNRNFFLTFHTFEIFPKKYWKETNGSVVHQSRNLIHCPLAARKGLRDRQRDKHCQSKQARTKDKETTWRYCPHTAAQ